MYYEGKNIINRQKGLNSDFQSQLSMQVQFTQTVAEWLVYFAYFSTDILVAADSNISGAKISHYVEFRTCDVLRMAQYKPLVHMEFSPVDN